MEFYLWGLILGLMLGGRSENKPLDPPLHQHTDKCKSELQKVEDKMALWVWSCTSVRFDFNWGESWFFEYGKTPLKLTA
jgi:hypothetical protein